MAEALAGKIKIQKIIPTGHFWDNAISVLNAWKRLGYFPNIWSPRSFNEYILSKKLDFGSNIELARKLTDKELVKEWLIENDLSELTVPTLGIFTDIRSVSSATFNSEIIAKSTHGSGSIIVRNAQNNNPFSNEDLGKFSSWLNEDYYVRSREPNYRGLTPKIIIEPLLRDATGLPPKDYKIFCCCGRPFAIQVDVDRFSSHKRQLYNKHWELLEYTMCYEREASPLPKPSQLEVAFEYARKISRPFDFVRVDFYFMPEGIKLGEVTFFPGNGAERFSPARGDWELGKLMLG